MDDIFGALEKLIDFTSFRHKVLASNIANVDTPNYKAKDVVFRSVFDAEALKLIGTDEQHIVSQKQGNGEKVIYENTSQWGDGNNVELDMEMAKMTENAIFYESCIELLSKRIRMFKDAIKGR